jgi:hypothetical protein
MNDVTNAKFAANNQEFRTYCNEAGVAPTKRQASKWLMGKGIASKAGKAVEARRVVEARVGKESEAVSILKEALGKRDGSSGDRREIRNAIKLVRSARKALEAADAAHSLESLALRRQRGVA